MFLCVRRFFSMYLDSSMVLQLEVDLVLFEWALPVHCELLRLMTNS